MTTDPTTQEPLQEVKAASKNNLIPVHLIQISICQACLDGEGEECHTPGCALFLHKVDLPITRELYEIIPRATQPESEDGKRMDELEDLFSITANNSPTWRGFMTMVAEKGFRKALDFQIAMRSTDKGA